jgi:hypothetical protein
VPVSDTEHRTPWPASQRVAFRLCALYLTLYVVCTQMGRGIPLIGLPLAALGQLFDPLVDLVARHVFHVSPARVMTGSGDRLIDWIQNVTVAVVALAGAVVWSAWDWRRPSYHRLDGWLRLLVRFGLGSTLVSYGLAKVFPLQMPEPSLIQLLGSLGHLTPMGVLWSSIGAAPGYERFVGSLELLGGSLLFVPRTATLGALVSLACATEVFALNLAYDVPVKLFSFHLVAMSLFLLAPHARRLAAAVFATGSRSRRSALLQGAFGLCAVALGAVGAHQAWNTRSSTPRPNLYGIWNVDLMRIDDIERPPLLTDLARWRRLVIESGTAIAVWRMNDTPLVYAATLNMDLGKITLRAGPDAIGSFTIEQPDATHLILDGTLRQQRMHLETTRQDLTGFLPSTRPIHWIQERPYTR